MDVSEIERNTRQTIHAVSFFVNLHFVSDTIIWYRYKAIKYHMQRSNSEEFSCYIITVSSLGNGVCCGCFH